MKKNTGWIVAGLFLIQIAVALAVLFHCLNAPLAPLAQPPSILQPIAGARHVLLSSAHLQTEYFPTELAPGQYAAEHQNDPH